LTDADYTKGLTNYSNLRTYRGVKIGDKATTALAKYDIHFGCAGYIISGDAENEIIYTKDTDLNMVF